jgi:hypothetical protein
MPALPTSTSLHGVITDIPAKGSPLRQPGSTFNALPHLARLLADLRPTKRIELDEFTWAMPFETLLARELGLPETATPWAALETQTEGTPCAWIHPAHWQVGMDHITMHAPSILGFDEALAREHFAVLAPFFAEVGITLSFHEPLRWLATGEVFRDMPAASLERAVGRNIDVWMPEAAHPAGAQMRRLQNEVQMLLYNHPLTDRAQAAGRTPMNSFWISGAGVLDALPANTMPQLDRHLQQPVWAQDTQAYSQAWQQLDQGPLRSLCQHLDAGEPVQLSLCSDNVAQTFEVAPPSLGSKLKRLLGGTPKADWSRWL